MKVCRFFTPAGFAQRRHAPVALGLLAALAPHARPANAQTVPTSALAFAAPISPAAACASLPTAPHLKLAAPDGEKGEMRGMWVVRDSLTSPQAVHQVVVTAVKYHLNALFVQARGRGDAWYDSELEPRAEALAKQPRDFDPLRQIIAEAHVAGLQVHAWMNTFLTWTGPKTPASEIHLWNAHRDWFACDRTGRCSCLPTGASEGAFLQPSNPDVQEHLVRVFADVATRYDVDGIHLDYCRYQGTGQDFASGTLTRFRAYMASQISPPTLSQLDSRLATDRLAYVHAFGAQWADWRRAQATAAVARISQAVKTAKPWLEMSAAVFPDAKEAFAVRGQDWAGWLRAGYLDAVALMAYGSNTERVLAQTRQAVGVAGGSRVYIGIGAWRLSAHDVAQKIARVRETGVAGVNLFSYGGVHDRPRYLDTLARGVFASRAAPPRMRWLPARGGNGSRSGGNGTRGDGRTGSGEGTRAGTGDRERTNRDRPAPVSPPDAPASPEDAPAGPNGVQ